MIPRCAEGLAATLERGAWCSGRSALGGSALGGSALGRAALGGSALGGSALGGSALGRLVLGRLALGRAALGRRPLLVLGCAVFSGAVACAHAEVAEPTYVAPSAEETPEVECSPLAPESAELEPSFEPDVIPVTTYPGPCRVGFDARDDGNDEERSYEWFEGRLVALSSRNATERRRATVQTDEEGRVTSVRGQRVANDGTTTPVRIDFERDACGKLVRRVWGETRTELLHDGGRIVGEERFVGDRRMTTVRYEYEGGQLAYAEYQHRGGSTVTMRHERDAVGRRTALVIGGSQATSVTRFEYEGDRVVREIRDEPALVIAFRHDDEGNLREEIATRDGEVLWTKRVDYSCHEGGE